jgi:nucleoside-diphosphate-sugar epimerase
MKQPHIPVVLVTGGAGFVGHALIKELTCENPVVTVDEIRIFDSRPENPFTDERITYIQGDIRNLDDFKRAAEGAAGMIHLASLVDWGTHSRDEVFSINVQGVRNAVTVCRETNIGALVYTSSLDAICTGKPIRDEDESLPYPDKFPNSYCESKALAERIVTEANGNGLSTVVLRPSGVWGEGDPFHISALLHLAEKGTYIRIGNGEALCMHVYVGNVAHAHVMALKALLTDGSRTAGNVYFLTDSPPENFFKFLDPVVEASGYPIKPKNLWIPKGIMYILGCLAEAGAWLLRPFKKINPDVSRFAVSYTCNDFTFSGDKARRDFGFEPKYGHREAFETTVQWFKKHGPVPKK